jgi:metal-responsive CopG/Arc/MetJ family transcriptional regulator
MTIDEPLLAAIDQLIAELQTTRSAFIRAALHAALRRHQIRRQEEQHAEGYAKHPLQLDEIEAWRDAQVWDAE